MKRPDSLLEGVRQDIETHIALRQAFLSIMRQKPEKRWCHEVSAHTGHEGSSPSLFTDIHKEASP